MRTGHKVLSLTAVAAMVLTASLALAGPGGQGKGPGAGFGGPCATQLSPEKQAAFQKLHTEFYTKTVQMRADLQVKRAELNAVAVSPNPDQGKIDTLSKEIGELGGKLLAERTRFRIQVAKEIGPEAAACFGGFGRGGHGGYGHRGHGGMGGGMGAGMGMMGGGE